MTICSEGWPRAAQIPRLSLLVVMLTGCTQAPREDYQGYLEADYAYIAAPVAGRLLILAAPRGSSVAEKAPLYTLEAELERQQLAEAEARLRLAQAQRADLDLGRRPDEIAVISARVREARSGVDYARTEARRIAELHARGLSSADARDRADNTLKQAEARLASTLAEQRSAALAGRTDAIAAADAAVAAAEAVVAQARWRLGQAEVYSVTAGVVADTMYQPGEWVPAGSPVLKLLPANGPYLRFFVPLDQLAGWRTGDVVQLACSGCPDDLSARVSMIATQPEYTPPIIFSESRADDLVVRMEAELSAHGTLPVGLPVTVRRG